jgi:hypothetical protein
MPTLIQEILKELELYTGKFPMEAMRAAIEQRDAITPELLRVVEAPNTLRTSVPPTASFRA